MTTADELFADAGAIEATDDELKTVGTLAKRATDLEEEVAAMEAALKDRKADLRKILENDLPAAMDAANLGEAKTSDGRKITIKEVVQASISKAKQEAAFKWLRDNGHEDLIKHEMKIGLGKGQDNVAGEIRGLLDEQFNIVAEDKESVHPQSLAAFCREQMSEGVDLPADLLGIYQARHAKIK